MACAPAELPSPGRFLYPGCTPKGRYGRLGTNMSGELVVLGTAVGVLGIALVLAVLVTWGLWLDAGDYRRNRE